jgi:YggT family protein
MSDIGFILTIINNFLQIYSVILIVRVLLTWFQNADSAYQIMSFLSPITDPYLNLFRSIIPPLRRDGLVPDPRFPAAQRCSECRSHRSQQSGQ